MNGRENAMQDSIPARIPAFLISRGSISRPARNIRKNTPRSDKTVRLSFGFTKDSTEGPIIIPANSSPTRDGRLNLWKTSPSSRAATSIMTTLTNSCSVAKAA